MKIFIVATLVIGLSQPCCANEWIAVGVQPTLVETDALEIKLWNFLEAHSKSAFWPKKSYRFQYKFVNESEALINAFCIETPNNNKALDVFPAPTPEELRKYFYQVKDGGNCFFNVKYNIKNASFNSLNINGDA